MPQLIAIGFLVAGGWYAWKTVRREMARLDRDAEAARTRPSQTLERDPKTGRYRLKDDR